MGTAFGGGQVMTVLKSILEVNNVSIITEVNNNNNGRSQETKISEGVDTYRDGHHDGEVVGRGG